MNYSVEFLLPVKCSSIHSTGSEQIRFNIVFLFADYQYELITMFLPLHHLYFLGEFSNMITKSRLTLDTKSCSGMKKIEGAIENL